MIQMCMSKDNRINFFWLNMERKSWSRAPVERHLAAGDDVLIEVDVQGALAIRAALPSARLAFIKPPSREVQRERLRARDPGADPADLDRRLAAATAEEAEEPAFDAVIVNDLVDRVVDELEALLDRDGST
jgi:guanylate kinase